MKKLYFLLLAASVLAGSANAQDTSIPDAFDCEEAYWVTSIEDEVNAVSPLLSVYRSFGDTVVDGEHWKKMHSCLMSATADIRTTRLYFNDLNYGNECVGLTRRDGDKVYGIVLDPNGFVHPTLECEAGETKVLYDFDASYSFGSETFCGVERKLFYTPLGSAADGIGELESGPFGPLQLVTTGHNNPFLRLCIVNGEVIYKYGGVMIGDYLSQLKFCYDMIMPTSYLFDGKNAWVIGQVNEGRIVSTYQIDAGLGRGDGSLLFTLPSGKTFTVDKWNSDLATITIDGVTRDLYDFSLGVGDTFDNGVVHLTVTAVDTAFIEGYERRILTMDSGEQWIDGIGSTRGLLAPVTEPTDEYEEVLLSCRSGDVVMYENPVYGNGIAATATQNGAHIYAADGVLHVEMAAGGEYRVGIYDMASTEVMAVAFTGQTLSHPLTGLPHGVYAVSVSDSNGNAVGHSKVVI